MVSDHTWNWLLTNGRDYCQLTAGDIAILGWQARFYSIPAHNRTRYFGTLERGDGKRGMVEYQTENDFHEYLWNAFIIADAFERNADLVSLR